jgi:hypothetical protein
MKIDLSKMVTQAEAAEMRRVSVHAIKLSCETRSAQINQCSGPVFLFRKEVEVFKPGGGRPRKS